jgi:hypothetical protein
VQFAFCNPHFGNTKKKSIFSQFCLKNVGYLRNYKGGQIDSPPVCPMVCFVQDMGACCDSKNTLDEHADSSDKNEFEFEDDDDNDDEHI